MTWLGRMMSRVSVDRIHAFALAGLFLVLCSQSIADPDFGWHLRAGEQIWLHGRPPVVDDFSYPEPGRPWIAYSWLAELAFWLIATHLGFHILLIACGTVVAATVLVVYRSCREAGAGPLSAWGVTASAGFAILLYTSQRPTILSFLFAALFAQVLARHRRGTPVRLWMLGPLMVLWANVHVYFVCGVAWVGMMTVWTAAEVFLGRSKPGQLGPLVRATLACSAATLITPYGLALLEHIRAISSQPVMLSMIVELTSPDFHGATGALVLPFVLLTIGAFALSRERCDSLLLTLTLIHLALGLYTQRNIPFFAILAAPLVARAMTAAVTDLWPSFRPLPTHLGPALQGIYVGLAASVAILIATKLPTQPEFEANLRPHTFPVDAVQFVRAQQPPLGRMFNGFNWGGFLIYSLYPDYRVSFDGRATVYGEEGTLEYMRVHRAQPGWQDYLEHVHADFVLWERGAALSRVLGESPNWVEVYADDLAVIYVRKDHPQRARLEREHHPAA